MVRVKYRYILAELITETHTTALKIPLGENDLKLAILHSVQGLYGDYGLACINAGFSIKMYNPVTRIVILRVRRKYQSVLKTTLPLITAVGKLTLIIRTLHLSGTIRSSLKSLIRFDKEKLTKLIKLKQLSGATSEELSELILKCQGRLAKRRLDK